MQFDSIRESHVSYLVLLSLGVLPPYQVDELLQLLVKELLLDFGPSVQCLFAAISYLIRLHLV